MSVPVVHVPEGEKAGLVALRTRIRDLDAQIKNLEKARRELQSELDKKIEELACSDNAEYRRDVETHRTVNHPEERRLKATLGQDGSVIVILPRNR